MSNQLTWEGIIIYNHTTTPKVTPSSHAGLQHTTYSITIWALISKCLWAGLCCNREETAETFPRSCLIHYGLWKTEQGSTMCALLQQNSHGNSLHSYNQSWTWVRLSKPTFGVQDRQWDRLLHIVLASPSRHKTQDCSLHELKNFILLLTTDYKGSKWMFQYRAFTWKPVFKRIYPFFLPDSCLLMFSWSQLGHKR